MLFYLKFVEDVVPKSVLIFDRESNSSPKLLNPNTSLAALTVKWVSLYVQKFIFSDPVHSSFNGKVYWTRKNTNLTWIVDAVVTADKNIEPTNLIDALPTHWLKEYCPLDIAPDAIKSKILFDLATGTTERCVEENLEVNYDGY